MADLEKKRGQVIIFVHGLAANRHQFYDCTQRLHEKNHKYFDAGVITLRKENKIRDKRIHPDARDKNLMYYPVDIVQDSLKNKFKTLKKPLIIKTIEFRKLAQNMKRSKLENKIRKLTQKGFNPIFRVEFSRLDISNDREIEELGRFVDAIKSYGTKVTMVGYSKGVLDVVGYAAKNPNKVDKIVLIGAPFEPVKLAKLAYKGLGGTLFNEGMRDLAGKSDSIDRIRDEWNEKGSKRVEAHTIASSWHPSLAFKNVKDAGRLKEKIKNRFGDGLVSCKGQLGVDEDPKKEFSGLKRYIIENSSILSSHHIFEPNDPTIYDLFDKIFQDEKVKSHLEKNKGTIVLGDKSLSIESLEGALESVEVTTKIHDKSDTEHVYGFMKGIRNYWYGDAKKVEEKSTKTDEKIKVKELQMGI